jgi:hypothetical protein
MADPFTTGVAVGFTSGVASGIGKQITEMVWTSSARWIKAKYQDHAPEIIAKAEHNSHEFLNRLSLKVAALEQESDITKSLMAANMGEPSFSVLLQKAVLASAQTVSAEKYEILSDIVSQRLKASPESIYTVTSQMAVDAISHCTTNQLHVLAFAASLTMITPNKNDQFSSEAIYKKACTEWLNHRLAPYRNLHIGPLDYAHLDAVSCTKFVHLVVRDNDLDEVLKKNWSSGSFTITRDYLYNLPIGAVIRDLWEVQRMRSLSLTTVGGMIGTLVSDRLCGADPTSFFYWQMAD